MKLLFAFIERDIALEKNYRLHFAVKMLAAFFQLAIFFYLSHYMNAAYYFPFVFTGLLFSRFFQFWLNVFAENIRQEQYWGTAEAVFLSPYTPLKVVVASSAGKFLLLLLEMEIYILLGVFVFGISFSARFLLLLPLIFCGAFAFGGLGLLAGSFILYFKRGDPVNWFLATSFDLLSGVYFPVSVLPKSLKMISFILPTTSALALWRAALFSGTSMRWEDIVVQLCWAVSMSIVGIISFRKAFALIRAKGELGSY